MSLKNGFKRARTPTARRHLRWGFVPLLLVLTAGALMFSASAGAAAGGSADLDQCGNDPAPSSHLDGCATSAGDWVNGNLGTSKSVYFEGDSIPYRMKFDNLTNGAGNTHHVTIAWDTTKSGKHAIDYLTTFNQTVADANPCLGVAGCNPASFDIEFDSRRSTGDRLGRDTARRQLQVVRRDDYWRERLHRRCGFSSRLIIRAPLGSTSPQARSIPYSRGVATSPLARTGATITPRSRFPARRTTRVWSSSTAGAEARIARFPPLQ